MQMGKTSEAPFGNNSKPGPLGQDSLLRLLRLLSVGDENLEYATGIFR